MKAAKTAILLLALFAASCATARREPKVQNTGPTPTLIWDSCGAGVEYFVYLRRSQGRYNGRINTGTNTSLLLTNLTPGIVYFTAVSAVSNNLESALSEEIAFRISEPR